MRTADGEKDTECRGDPYCGGAADLEAADRLADRPVIGRLDNDFLRREEGLVDKPEFSVGPFERRHRRFNLRRTAISRGTAGTGPGSGDR